MMDNKLHRDFKRYEHNRYQHKLIGGNSAGNPKHTIKIQRMFWDGSCIKDTLSIEFTIIYSIKSPSLKRLT